MNRSFTLAVLFALLLAFGLGGWWLAQQRAPHRHQLEKAATLQGTIYWTCAMHPQVRQDAPGNCPICGMQLIEKQEAAPATAAPASGDGFVQIDPRMLQNLGVRTAKVLRGGSGGSIAAVGQVSVDESRLVAVVSRTAGFVEQLGVHSVGEAVRRGQFIAGVYSPELYAAQQEFVLVARSDPALAEAARQRLSLLGLAPAQIERLAATGIAQRQVAVAAPAAGVITELNVREGAETQPGMPLVRIADLSRVWLLLDLPEALAGTVAPDSPAQARFTALPGRSFEGRVDYVYPSVDAATRSLRLRLVFDNSDGALKPGMYAQATLAGRAAGDGLMLPSEAVIRTGRRELVIVAEGAGRFRPVEVRSGSERDGMTEILRGLDDGAEVVTSGQFLIESEASLRGVLQRLGDAPPSAPHAGH